jgi:RHS repeat-associated protein
MPQGLGRYGIEDAESPNYDGVTGDSLAGYIPNAKFEWYLKNHIGSTMLVYGTQSDANPQHVFVGTPLAAYDYRAFGEMVEMLPPAQKVTENFTGKEHDDEIALDYFGARYLDPMLGMWISVDPKRQFASPYLYAGNEMNPINGLDSDGNVFAENEHGINVGQAIYDNLAKENFFGSDILKNDWDEMKNSDRMITFNYSSMEEGGHSWKSQDAIDINLNYKNNLVMSAIIGRHEWDHLKGVKKASWHENPKKDFIKDVPYVDLLGVNNAIREGTLPKDHEAYGKEYDPIYGRDYDAFMQLELK